MKASEIMTKDVVTVAPDTPVRDIAVLMTKHRISGVPVVAADGRLVGIVSESDLMHRAETGTERRRKWWLGLMMDSDSLARDYAKAHGLRATDVLTSPVVTVDGEAELGEVADMLDQRKRVPVVTDGRLVGMITRGDLVRALAQTSIVAKPADGSDAAIYKTITMEMRKATWLSASYTNVSVHGGIAQLNGVVPSIDQRRALRILVEEIPGVVKVVDNLRVGQLNAMI
jgi:CBS domain-containing protein